MAICCLPLVAIAAFIMMRNVVLAAALSSRTGSGLVRAMPAFRSLVIVRESPPPPSAAGTGVVTYYATNGSPGPAVVAGGAANLRALFTLDPNVVGTPRSEALPVLAAAYAASALAAGAALAFGLLVGGAACRLSMRPAYWMRQPIRRERTAIYWLAALPAALWAWPTTVAVATIYALCFPTEDWYVALYKPPPLGWIVTLLGAPIVPSAAAVVRGYRKAVRQRIGAPEHLCDCDYECPPRTICPECGSQTRDLPARVNWRWCTRRIGHAVPTQ